MMGLRVSFFIVFVGVVSLGGLSVTPLVGATTSTSTVAGQSRTAAVWKKSVCRDVSTDAVVSVKVVPSTLEQQGRGCAENMFYFYNFPKNEKVQIFQKRLLQKDEEKYWDLETVLIDDNDNLYIDGQFTNNFAVYAKGFLLGEKVQLQFRREDGSVVAETEYTPRPLRVKSDRGSFSLEMVLELAAPTLYSMRLCGVGAGETVQVASISGKEALSYDVSFDPATGQIYMPGILGQSGGYAMLQISRHSGDKVKAEIPWGVSLFDVVKVVDGWNRGI